MEESLKCAFCKAFARDAVESNCQCALLYCDKCSSIVESCMICNTKLSKKDGNIDENIFGFTENKLARRMIGSLKPSC